MSTVTIIVLIICITILAIFAIASAIYVRAAKTATKNFNDFTNNFFKEDN